MIGAVMIRTLTTHWRQMLYWGVGMALMAVFILAAIPLDALKGYADLLGGFPPAISQLIGISDPKLLTTPDGFLSIGFFGYAPLIMAVFAVSAGLNVTANEEEEGLLDVVLSWPLPRWQLVLGRFLAWIIMSLGIVAMTFLGLVLGRAAGSMEINLGRAFETTLNLVPTILLMLAFTVMVATLVRRRWMVSAIAGGTVAFSYFLKYLSEAFTNDFVKGMSRLSFFTYYDNTGVSLNGLNLGNWMLLMGITVIFLVGALWSFQRRDVGL